MKRLRGDPESTTSLFPHEFRVAQIIAFMCCCRNGATNGNPAMGAVPRDIVRMIFGWIKADFTVGLKHQGYVWHLYVHEYEGWYAYYWMWKQAGGSHDIIVACKYCLCFAYQPLPGLPMEWLCNHHIYAINMSHQVWDSVGVNYFIDKTRFIKDYLF